MKDIAKMREEMERKIKYAEMSNKIEAEVGIECSFMPGGSPTQPGKEWLNFGEVTKEQAAKLLKIFPWTERAKVSGKDAEMSYLLELHKYPKEICSRLEIEWIHNEWFITLKIQVRTDDEVLMTYFKWDRYQIDDSTIGLYYGAVSRSVKECLKEVRCLNFNCGQVIRYQGGYFRQMSEGHAECIISEIIGE